MPDNTIDTLDIQISSNASKAIQSINSLIDKLNSLNKTLNGLDSNGLRNYARELGRITAAFNSLSKVNTSGLDKTISKINALNKVDLSNLRNQKISLDLEIKGGDAITSKLKALDAGEMTSLSTSMTGFATSLKELGNVNFKGTGLNSVINSINRLGKSDFSQFDSGKLGEIITELSKIGEIPDVSSNVSRFATAMAKLAGTGQYIGNVSTELPLLSAQLKSAATELSSMASVSSATNAFITSLAQLANAGDKTSKTAGQLPVLTQEVLRFFNAMSSAPNVSTGTVRMTEALATLASSGRQVVSTTEGISNAFSSMTSKSTMVTSAIRGIISAYSSFISKAVALGKKGVSAFSQIGNAASSAKAKIASLGSITGKLSELYAKGFLAKRALDIFSKPVKSAMDYVETLNYFNSAFNQVAENIDTDEWKKSGIKSAEAYADSFEQRAKQLSQKLTGFSISDTGEMTRTNTPSLGLDPEKTMQYQATFAQMASSMGDSSETALKLSNALTMIGSDLASVRNMEFEDVWQDMASGLTGMSRAMDKYGINIRNANMQQELYNLGINTSISNLTQADKTILRTIILLNNSKYAWGDLANTINQPANQIRMLQSNFASLGRTIGSLFIPLLQTVLPYINAIVIALQRMFAWFAKLLGIKLSNFVSSTGGISVDTSNIADNMDTASDAIDNANTSAKKLEKTLSVLSFDELNQLNDNSDSGSTSTPSTSGNGAGNAHLPALDAALDDALSAYQKAWEDAYKKMSNKANKMADAIVNAFKKKDWKGLGKIMADGINYGFQKLYDFINWDNVGPKITKFTKAFIETFNSLVDNVNFDLIGKTFGAGINTLVNTANQLLEGIDFINLGKKLSEGFNGLFQEVNWGNLGNMLGNNFMKTWDIFYGFVTNLNFEEIGIAIGDGLNGIFEKVNFEEIAATLTTGINGVFTSLANFTEEFDWNKFTKNIGNGISKFLSDMDWKENGKALGDFIQHLCDAINDTMTVGTFMKLGRGIADFIGQLPWADLLKTAVHLLVGGLVGAIATFFATWSSDSVADNIVLFLGKAFIAVKIANITGISGLVKLLVKEIGLKIMSTESASLIAGNLSSLISSGLSGAATAFKGLASSILPLVGTAGLIVGVGVAAVYATSKLAGFIEKMQGGNGVGTTFGNTMDNFIQTLQGNSDIIPTVAEEVFQLKESLEKEGMTAEEQATATQKIIDKLGEMGVTSGQATQAFEEMRQKGLITDDMFDILSESIETLGTTTTNTASQIDLSKYSVDDLADVVKGLRDQLHLSNEQCVYLDTALYDMPNASGTAQGAFENIMRAAEDMGLNTESVARIFAEAFPDAVQKAKDSVDKNMNSAQKSVSDSTGKMKTDVESDLQSIQDSVSLATEGVNTTTVTNWGNSAQEVSKNLDAMKQAANIKLGEMQQTVNSQFSSQYNTMTNKWKWASERIVQIVDGLDASLSKKIPEMSKYFTQLSKNIENSLGGLRTIGVNAATSLYNGMKSVTMPRLSYYISEWRSHDLGNGNTSSTPVYSPSWYAAGGYFKSASVIGVGEAGDEAVLPLENRNAMKNIANSIMSAYEGNMGLSADELARAVERGVVTAYMNNSGMGGGYPEYIMNSIKLNEREVARLITKAQNNINSRSNPSPAY